MFKAICNCVCPYTIEDCIDKDEAKDKYDDYQQFLNTLMTIGTLLMGFILTGTLLNYTYTGEQRRNKFAESFDRDSLWACSFATVSVMASLLISVRGSVTFRNNGPKMALRAMRNSTICTGLAELSIYMSICFFGQSVLQYLWWAQKGPTGICSEWKGPSAECAQLTEDFAEAAARLCASWQDITNLEGTAKCDMECQAKNRVCLAMRPRQDGKGGAFQDPNFPSVPAHAWGRVYKQGALMMTMVLSDEMCRRNQMQDIAEHLCDKSVLGTSAAQTACSQANTDFIKADDCSAEALSTMTLCSNVCREAGSLLALLNSWKVPATWVFATVVCIRFLKILQQLYAVFRFQHLRSKHKFTALINELGIGEHFESDEEDAIAMHDRDSDTDDENCELSRRTPRAPWLCPSETSSLIAAR